MRIPRTTAVMAAMLCCLHVTTARAQGDDDDEGGWYGWQTLMVDAATVTVATVGAVQDEPALFWPGTAGFVLATPLLHLVHGRADSAALSVGLRAGVPLLAGGVALIMRELSQGDLGSGDDRELLIRAGSGLILGAALSMLVDAKFLAHEKPDHRIRLEAALTQDLALVSLRARL